MRIARRALVVGGIALALPTRATAQSSRVPRVGFLTPASSDRTIPISAFRSALAGLGYVEGQNVALEFRLAAGDISRLPELAAELAALPADVIVVDGGIAVPAVMAATKSIRNSGRSGRARLCSKPFSSWRQHHGVLADLRRTESEAP